MRQSRGSCQDKARSPCSQGATKSPHSAPTLNPRHTTNPPDSCLGRSLFIQNVGKVQQRCSWRSRPGDRSLDFGTAPPCGRAPMSPRRRGRAVTASVRRAASLCKSRRCISRLRWTANAEEMHDGSDTEFERLLSPEDVARICGLSRRAVYRAIARGELRAVRLCHRLRIRPAELERWIGGQISSSESRRLRRRNRPVAVSPRGSLRSMLNDADGQGGGR
jgi:excisionase family DNA binding protein